VSRRNPSTGAEAAAAPRAAWLIGSLKGVAARMPLHLTLMGLMALWSIPTIALLVSSFREPTAIAASGWWNAITEPFDFTIDNYEKVLTQRGMARSFWNSVIITIPSTILVILVAAFAAYAFAWMRFPGRNVLFLVVVALLVVPLQMTLIPVLRLYVTLNDNLGFLNNDLPLLGGNVFGVNSFPGLWMAHVAYGLPFAVFLLRNFFGALPRDLFESAYLDGASDLGVFFRIVLPLSGPAIAALAIFQFLWVWQDLLVALVLLGDPDLAPMMLTINSLVSSFGSQYQLLTAAAFISMLVPLFLFFALQRYFVQGILAGAVKG
jgi:alpha-glucoside transport system permease protein